MILLDLHQTLVASVFAMIKMKAKIEIDLLRHVVLNSIRASRLKFKINYGELVICADSRNYWRKSVFPFYKANRKSAQIKSPVDWQKVFPMLDQLKQEFKENLPYKFIQVDSAEADDIIATLVKTVTDSGEKVMIISGDGDFAQLQKFPNVAQWNPIKSRFVVSPKPESELILKIISGDAGDGIPNILSDDDTLVTPGKSQRPMTKKKVEGFNIDAFDENVLTEEQLRNFCRNRTLIDFDYIPSDIAASIVETFNSTTVPSKKQLKPYFMNNSLGKLFSSIGDF